MGGKDEWRVTVIVREVWIQITNVLEQLHDGQEAVCACMAQGSLEQKRRSAVKFKRGQNEREREREREREKEQERKTDKERKRGKEIER